MQFVQKGLNDKISALVQVTDRQQTLPEPMLTDIYDLHIWFLYATLD